MSDQQDNQQLFQELENRLAALEPKDISNIRRDRAMLVAMAAGIVMTVPSILGAKAEWSSLFSAIGIALELCALGVFTYRQMRDVIPEFINAKQKFAAELDISFAGYEEIRKWLKSLSPEVRFKRFSYIESRLESMGQRYPIVFGAVDKLGVLPALVGLFLQLRAITTLSLTTGIVGLTVLFLYGMALWLARFRLQLQAYARLLKAADLD